MKISSYITPLFVIISATVAEAQSIADHLQGKCGGELKTAIFNNCRPQLIVSGYIGAGGAWEAFRKTDAVNGCVVDRYSASLHPFTSDGHSPSAQMSIDQIINISWWGDCHPYNDTLKLDLHHLIPCNQEVPSNKRDYPPGIVNRATYDNGVWKSGVGEISGIEVNMYEPADEYKGDFARAIMYAISIYPAERWSGLGTNFCKNNTYPTLNNYAQRLLLNWHRLDPVSEFELKRNNAVAELQGNRNPFIDFPQLVEHVWGSESETPFETESQRVPLHSTYRISDNYIYLYHPSIPENVTWSINDTDITATHLIPADLGSGIHQLRFRNDTIKGKLMIKIID